MNFLWPKKIIFEAQKNDFGAPKNRFLDWCANLGCKFTLLKADPMGSYPPGAVVARVLYCTIAYCMFLYYSLLYATVDSMSQFHRQSPTFTGRFYGYLSPWGYSSQSTILYYSLLYVSILQCTVCYCRLHVPIWGANSHFLRQILWVAIPLGL